MNLLRVASRVRNWSLNLGELARIWKAGCIIRAQFLGRIKAAYERDAGPPEPAARSRVLARSWPRGRRLAARRRPARQPGASRCSTTSAALGYYDSLRRERLPANLTQAQRDFFGAHTYERVDRPGLVPHRLAQAVLIAA